MNASRQAQWNFFSMEWKQWRVLFLMSPLIYLTCLVAMNPRLRSHIPSFTTQQDIWFSFVQAYQNSSFLMTTFLPFFVVLRSVAATQKQGGLYYVMTRPITRRFYFWANYATVVLQMILIPVAGTALTYLIACAIFYHSHGWVGGMGAIRLPLPTGPSDLENYRYAMNFLTKNSLVKLMLEQIVVGYFLSTAIFCALQATGKLWTIAVALLAVLGGKIVFFGIENHTLLQWFTLPHTALAMSIAIAIALAAQMTFQRRDL
jgi:hypothetical protein